MTKFSIIVPVYNVEKYLTECIESILIQTFKDFEVILVDDGSKDNSGKICDEYAEKDSRVKVIHKQNGGQSTARNIGVKVATGDYIVFLDSDDYIAYAEFFYDLSQRIHENNVDIVAFKYCEYFENSGKTSHSNYDYSQIADRATVREKIEYLVRQDAFFCSAWSKIVKREVLIKHDIQFDETSKCEDMDWFFSVIEKCETLWLLDKEGVVYRRRDNSVTSTLKLGNLENYLNFFKKWEDKLSKFEDKARADVLYGAAGKLYLNLLIAYLVCKDRRKKQIQKELKSYVYFLDYDLNPKVNKVKKFKKLFGFYGLLIALKVLLIMR